MNKITQGASPCYSAECQSQKSSRISQLFAEASLLPDTDSVLPSLNEGVESAYRLTRIPFPNPLLKKNFPQTLADWKLWWEKRFSFEDALKSEWMKTYSEIYSLSEGLQIYAKLATGSEETKTLVQQALDRGAARAAEAMIESSRLMQESAREAAQGNASLAKQLKQAAFRYDSTRVEIEKNFGGEIRPILEEIFPDATFNQIISFFFIIDHFMQSEQIDDIFDPNFETLMQARAARAKTLAHLVQDFQDLEYGVVGINNFYSPVNPQIAAEQEIPIQNFLDKVDTSARVLVDLTAFYLFGAAGDSVLGESALARLGVSGISQLISMHFNKDPSEFFWPKSNRSEQLVAMSVSLEDQMEKRRTELVHTQALLKAKLDEIKSEIEILKKTQKNQATEDPKR